MQLLYSSSAAGEKILGVEEGSLDGFCGFILKNAFDRVPPGERERKRERC